MEKELKPLDSDVRQRALTLVTEMKRVFVDFAEIMFEVKQQELWKDWGFRSFEDYLEKELKISRSSRTVYYFMDIYRSLCKNLGVPKERVREIGWGNAKELPKLERIGQLTEDNIDEWLEKAETMSQKEFSKEVKRHIGTSDPEPKSYTKVFKLDESQLSNVEMAISIASELSNVQGDSFALDMICLDFNSKYGVYLGKEDKRVVIRKILASLEKECGIKVIAYDDKGIFFGFISILSENFFIEQKVVEVMQKDLSLQVEVFKNAKDKFGKSGKIILSHEQIVLKVDGEPDMVLAESVSEHS